ncbi:hypothetical protein ACIQNV_37425 [Streptomyces hydrogenans]|uniref:hypothetical protein n=1 Tax=Streptomyces hydrogenans TaxID=1873719 RepID=UPI00381967CB
MHAKARSTTESTKFKVGDHVLFRDPSLFWAGKSDHTFVCRVEYVWLSGGYDLVCLNTRRKVSQADPDYMRLLPAVDAMRDIDTAPLHADGAANDMTAAALAWLTQQHATANGRPELPAPRD